MKNRYKVFRTQVLNEEQAKNLQKSENLYDFWKPIRSGLSTDVLVAPHSMNHMTHILKNLNIEFYEYIENVEKLIQEQKSTKSYQKYSGKINFDQYYSHDDVC